MRKNTVVSLRQSEGRDLLASVMGAVVRRWCETVFSRGVGS